MTATSVSLRIPALLSLLLSLTAITLIGYQWLGIEAEHPDDMHVIADKVDLENLLSDAETIELRGNRRPYLVPTGLFIQSLAFSSASDVNVTGYVWQKYPQGFPEGFTKGVVFPEEVESDNTVIQERYRGTVDYNGEPHELIGWYFDVTLRQSFDNSAYPLDILTVWLRLWPRDFYHNDRILFIPDFEGYVDLRRETFGLDQGIVQGEWVIDETFFGFNEIAYDTAFGYVALGEEVLYEEFFFSILVKRKFINAFIKNLVPLLVVALLLFGALMTISSDPSQSARFGFDTSSILATCSALFFVVLLAHVQVRNQFASAVLVYIEYFYLVMYLFLLLIALNAYLFSLNSLQGRTFLHFRDNLIAKLAYWPLLLWSMAIITWLDL